MTAEMKPNAPIATRLSPGPARSANDLQLLVLTGLAAGQSLLIDKRVRVGKAPDNDLVLPDDTVSRHHCEIERRTDSVWIKTSVRPTAPASPAPKSPRRSPRRARVLRFGEVEVVVRAGSQRVDVLPSEHTKFGPAIGESLAMRTVFGVLERIAPTDATVLLEGETGTGKDVLARAIHLREPARQAPFVVVDCGAVSYTLIESELFGHERGAFTGAVATRQGAFELADGGTLFLDEVGELPLDVQPKLLRVLETREFRRVGGNKTLRDRRARHRRDQARSQARGRARASSAKTSISGSRSCPSRCPSLRTRREDIRGLVHLFLQQSSHNDPDARRRLVDGRRRDLGAGGARLAGQRPRAAQRARARHLPRASRGRERDQHRRAPGLGVWRARRHAQLSTGPQLPRHRASSNRDFERRYVKWLLGRHNGNISAAAREAQMDRKYLYDLAKKHGMRGKDDDAGE